jgi:hypothetical protein
MRHGSLSLLLVLSLAAPLLYAEEAVNDPLAEPQTDLAQPLAEEQREDPNVSLDAAATDAELAHLRQENLRLRMRLQQEQQEQQEQSKMQPRLLNDQQQWFAVGGGVGVLGFLLGVLTARGRRRRQWLN